MPAPIALFVYNRPAHTRQTVEALQKNALAGESDLFIFSDAPKTGASAEKVREVREYIRTITGFRSVSLVERDKNWGLANSIIDGVTTLVNEHGRIIVLEDDLIVTPHFLDYMNRALDRYEDEQRVIQVSGYMFPVKVAIKEDALFLPLTTSWGWATWKRAWQLFDPDAKGYAQLKADPVLRKRFNLDGAYDYFSMLEAQLAGRVDSWAVRWYLSTFLRDGLTLYPKQSLIINDGFDGSGTHCSASENQFSKSDHSASHLMMRCLPTQISVNKIWFEIRPKISQNGTAMKVIKQYLRHFMKFSQRNPKYYFNRLLSFYFILSGRKPWKKGYYQYKKLYIDKVLSEGDFDSNKLPENYGCRLDERVVEYPWFFSRCPSKEGKLLDAGSVLNFDYIQSHPTLRPKNVFISTLAPEKYCFWKRGVSYVFEDLRSSCFRDEYFDWIASLSTIEHIGLDNSMLYTADASKNESHPTSYLAAVMEYRRMLKPGGVLYLSFPFGKHVNRKWFQIFDGAMVDEIIAAFNPGKVEQFYFKYEATGWKSSTREASKDATYFDIHTQSEYDADYAAASRAIVCLELVK